MLPGGAMSELIGRIGALQLITKDQIMNLAVELLPPARVRELMSQLGVLVGFQEWDQISAQSSEHLPAIGQSYTFRSYQDLPTKWAHWPSVVGDLQGSRAFTLLERNTS